MGLYDHKVDMHFGSTQGWASMEFRESKGLKLETLSMPVETIAGRIPGGGKDLMERLKEFPNMANWVQVVRASARGTVRNGLFNQPDVRYGLNEKDMLVFREGMYITAQLHFEAGAKYVISGIQGLPAYITRDQVDLIKNGPTRPTAYFGACSHLFGGCIMGSNEQETVVDPQGKVHGYENLYVADASNLPTNLGVNPQHTIMANAWHLAETYLASQ
jgi:choline dehydrogenase-like flavoprotein